MPPSSTSSRKPSSARSTTQSKAKKRVIIDLSDDEEDVALKKTAAKAEAVSSSSRAGASSSGAGAGGSQRNGSRKGFSGFFSAFGSSQPPKSTSSALPSPLASTSKASGPSSSRKEAPTASSSKKKGKQPAVIVLSDDDDDDDAIDGGPVGGEDVQEISDFDMHEPDSFSSPPRKPKKKDDVKGKNTNKRNGKANNEDDVKGTGVKRKRKVKDDRSGSGSGSEDWDLGPMAADMWTDLYAPKSVAELAPSKSRITLLRNWLEEAIHGRPQGLDEKIKFSKEAAERVKKYRRVLLLTGPAGAAKSTSVRVVAEELGLEIMEWTEGFEDWGMGGDFERESLSGRLLSFLSRNTYGSLDISGLSVTPSTGIASSSSSPSTSKPPLSTLNPKHKPRILLITSLPNLSHFPTRQAFNQALLEFASTYSAGSCPLVVVVPDVGASGAAEEPWSVRGGGGAGEGGWDLRSVVGEGVMKHPAVTTIDFLSVAPTFIIKALKRILPLAVPQASLRPPNEILTAIAQTANGDLRSAINSLEMMMKSGSGSGSGNGLKELMKSSGGLGPKKGKGSRGGKGKTSGSKEMRDLLNRIATREQSLGLFHALGKVLYNKRIGDPDENGDIDEAAIKIEDAYIREHPLPAHLDGNTRRRYENDFDALIGSVPTDTASFMLWLQQNLPPFCVDIDQLHAALDNLGDADGMKADDDMWQRSLHAIAYAFHVAVRGCVASLPHPVPRKSQKIYKPEFFGWVKATKENKLSLETAGVHLVKGKLGVSDTTHSTTDAEGSEEREESRFGGQISKHVLATEFMPMLRLLQRTGHDIPIPLDDAFQHFPYNDPNDLDILNEKDEPNDMNVDDQEDMLPVKEVTRKMKMTGGSKKDELDDLPEEDDDLVAGLQGTATYLMEDDIVED